MKEERTEQRSREGGSCEGKDGVKYGKIEKDGVKNGRLKKVVKVEVRD